MANRHRREKCLEELHRLPLTATAADIKDLVQAEFPALMEEIIIAGARTLTASLRRMLAAPLPADREIAKAARRETERHLNRAVQTIAARVEVGAAVVECFDKMLVDGKRLGDCVKVDLLRERARLLHRGNELLSQSGLLERISACLGPNETVRTADNRMGILDVLRDHFQPA